MKYLIWHSPRVGSNLLCNLLHQTGVAGIADYEHRGFPLGSIGKITAEQFPEKLAEYEQKLTTPNGVFACKLSWEVLRQLTEQVGVDPVYNWLNTIDFHVFQYRQDLTAQAVSFYIAGERKYFSTLKQDKGETIHPNPPYSYNKISLIRMKIKAYNAEMKQYFEDYSINPFRVSYENLSYSHDRQMGIVKAILFSINQLQGLENVDLTPQIRKQHNPLKLQYIKRYNYERLHNG